MRSRLQPNSWIVLVSVSMLIFAWIPAECFANSYSYKGVVGVSGDGGLTLLPPKYIFSPKQVPGITGGFRIFYGITNTIGVEAMIHGTNYRNFDPLYAEEPLDASGEATIVAFTPVKRLQQQQFSLGAIYNLDLFRVLPSFSIGIARVRTGAGSILYGETVMDNHLYISGALEYRITRNFWAGALIRINIPLTDESSYNGPTSFFVRVSYVWTRGKLKSTQ